MIVLGGRQAFDLYLKCLQLILRHQLWFLVHEKGLPAELETVTFDLWSLRVAQLGDRIVSGEHEIDSQSQIFSTIESEESDTSDNEQGMITARKGRDQKLKGAPNLHDCVALCYLSLLTLRLPTTPGDIYSWVTDGKMAYRRAIKLLPLAMRDRLPPSYRAVLDPQTMMNYKRFYTTLTNLQISFEKDHGVVWPPINVPILLFRYLKELALPLELYSATLRLGELLGYDYALHYNDRQRLGVRNLPEAQLAGCLIVCVKLFYPFDKVKRYPTSSSEPTAAVVDWKKWCKAIKASNTRQKEGNPGLTTEDLTKLTESNVFDMQPNQLDQYLDFYADTFLDNAEIQRTSENSTFRSQLYGWFPIEGETQHPPVQLSDRPSHLQKLETVRAVHGKMKTRVAVGEEEAEPSTTRPGQMYPLWKKEQDVPERAKVLYEEAARIAGLSMNLMVSAVFFTEMRVEKWRKKQKDGTKTRDT
jgi:RNA polymerase I-specific transcription initiation factor RRN7